MLIAQTHKYLRNECKFRGNSIIKNRPFQELKENGRTICSECFKSTNSPKEIIFFLEDTGLAQHFRVKHGHLVLNETYTKECRVLFQNCHGQETAEVLKQLSKERLKAVLSSSWLLNYTMSNLL
jgi:calcineurin-like phosphoesterase family protein